MTTIDYIEYIRSEEWHTKAKAAKRAAGYRCIVCGSSHNLEAHHKTYARLGCERPEDIAVLCDDCHARYHDKLDTPVQIELPAPRRQLIVTVSRSRADYLKLCAVYALVINQPGPDMFSTNVVVGGKPLNLDFPNAMLAVTPDFVAAIEAIVGVENVEVRELGADE